MAKGYIKTREQKGIGGGHSGGGGLMSLFAALAGAGGDLDVDFTPESVTPDTGEGVASNLVVKPKSKFKDFISGGQASKRAAGMQDAFTQQQLLLPGQTNAGIRLAQAQGDIGVKSAGDILRDRIAQELAGRPAIDALDVQRERDLGSAKTDEMLRQRTMIDPLDIDKAGRQAVNAAQAAKFGQIISDNPELMQLLTTANRADLRGAATKAGADEQLDMNRGLVAQYDRPTLSEESRFAQNARINKNQLSSAQDIESMARLVPRNDMLDQTNKAELASRLIGNTALAHTPGALGLTQINDGGLLLGDLSKAGPINAISPGKAGVPAKEFLDASGKKMSIGGSASMPPVVQQLRLGGSAPEAIKPPAITDQERQELMGLGGQGVAPINTGIGQPPKAPAQPSLMDQYLQQGNLSDILKQWIRRKQAEAASQEMSPFSSTIY